MKKIENILKIFFSITHANEGRAEIFFSVLNFAIPVFMGTYIFLNPMPLSAVNEFCFYLSVAALIILISFKKTVFTFQTPLTLPFLLFFLWAVFGLFFTLDFKNTLHDLRGHLLEYLIVFYLLVNYFNSQKKMEIFSLIIIVSATIFSIGAIIQYYFIEGFPFGARLGYTFKEMHTGWMCFITIFAATLALNNFHKSKIISHKMLLLVCFFIMGITTLLNQSRGALIGLLVSLVILCFNNKKNLILVIIALLFMFLLPGIKGRVMNEGIQDIRIKMNRLTLEIIKEYPIAGVGFGMEIYGNKNLLDLEKFNKKLPPQYQQERIITSPHNTILDITVRTGIIGLLLFLNILLTSLFMLWKILRLAKSEYFKSWAICLFACFASFMVQAMFADTTFGPRIVVFYTILAMIAILWNLAQKEKKNEDAASTGMVNIID